MRHAAFLLLLFAPAAFAAIVDPTRPFTHSRAVAPLKLESTVVAGARKLAMIDGRFLPLGARVGGAVIVDITPYEVVLRRGGRLTRLRLLPRLKRPAIEAPLHAEH